MDGWIIWAYLALNVLILIQNFTQKLVSENLKMRCLSIKTRMA